MLHLALFLCIFGQVSHLGVANEPVNYLLNDMMKSSSQESSTHQETGLTEDLIGGDPDDYDIDEVETTRRRRSESVASSRRRSQSFAAKSFGMKMAQTDWDQASKTMVDAMMREFFKKVTLQTTERECLDQSVGKFTGDIAGLVQSGVKALQPVLAPKDGEERASLGSAVPLLLSGISDITDLVSTVTTIMKNCLQADGLNLLKSAAHRMKNFSYVEHQLLANGADITKALAEAVIAFQDERFSEFGQQLGFTARKVILSTNNKAIELPEGYATEQAIEEASSGISQGFFAAGSSLHITDRADASVDIKIALDECIADNDDLFKDIFKGIWELATQLVANKAQHAFSTDNSEGMGGSPKWVQELVLAMARIPMALTRCNLLDQDTEDMLADSLKTLGSLKFEFDFPEDSVRADEASKKVAEALIRFDNKDYYGFGKELGKLLRELLLLAFPQEYSVDDSGLLRRQLTMAGFIRKQNRKIDKYGGPMVVFSCAIFVLLMSAVAMKGLRTLSSWRTAGRPFIDVESSRAEEEDLEVLE